MCGILFSGIHPCGGDDVLPRFEALIHELEFVNSARGPDAENRLQAVVEHENSSIEISFFASELLLRGDSMVVQPHHDAQGNVFCWNGEVFEGSLDIGPDENDGVRLFSLLQSCEDAADVRDLFGGIEGPYAFVYYQQSTRCLYFARDPLGRRSLLLIQKPTLDDPYIILGSVSTGAYPGYEPEEISTDYLFCLDLGKLAGYPDISIGFNECLTNIPRIGNRGPPLLFAVLARVNTSLPSEDSVHPESIDQIPDFLIRPVEQLIAELDRSVKLQVRDIARLKKCQGRASVAVLFSGGIDSTILAFLAHRHVPLDEPIDLLNVAFENPRKMQSDGKSKKEKPPPIDSDAVSYLVPDRVTGLTEVQELKRLCPGRIWNFVEVDVPFEVSQCARPSVEAMMFPGRTVMDLSLAIALYFASMGQGTVRSTPTSAPEPYTSEARVLLNGLGSDELLGGYGRYRTAYLASGWKAVIEELQLDLDRIPTRNLGRDDRVVSSRGKESRHPFLSMSVVNFVSQLPIHYKVDPRLDVGFGDKLLLRLAARKLGLVEASGRKKRAMQFGSHSARMQSGEAYRRGDLMLA